MSGAERFLREVRRAFMHAPEVEPGHGDELALNWAGKDLTAGVWAEDSGRAAVFLADASATVGSPAEAIKALQAIFADELVAVCLFEPGGGAHSMLASPDDPVRQLRERDRSSSVDVPFAESLWIRSWTGARDFGEPPTYQPPETSGRVSALSDAERRAVIEAVALRFDEPDLLTFEDGYAELSWDNDGLAAGLRGDEEGLWVFLDQAEEEIRDADTAEARLRRIFADNLVAVTAIAAGEPYVALADAANPAVSAQALDPAIRRKIEHVGIQSWSGARDQTIYPVPGDVWIPEDENNLWASVR